jgi:hypothetical protein
MNEKKNYQENGRTTKQLIRLAAQRGTHTLDHSSEVYYEESWFRSLARGSEPAYLVPVDGVSGRAAGLDGEMPSSTKSQARHFSTLVPANSLGTSHQVVHSTMPASETMALTDMVLAMAYSRWWKCFFA